MIFLIKDKWNRYGFEIIVCISIMFIFLYAIYCSITSKKGTWNDVNQNFDMLADASKRSNKRNINYSSAKNNALYNEQTLSKYNPRESKGENECRRVLEKFFNLPFKKARPDFLRNPVTGNFHNLELDCYNDRLKLAVEYNGIQHYQYTPYFHQSKDSFYNQKYRDMFKRQRCKEENIELIEVPYTVKVHDIESYLYDILKNKQFI